MSTRRIVAVTFLGVVLSLFAGCVPTSEMKLNLSPQNQTAYRVINESGKDYIFIQPSVNKTKERHTLGRLEMVFTQTIEAVDKEGNATADIAIKELKCVSDGQKDGDTFEFDSTADSSDPLYALIGQSYKIKISPDGKVEVLDAKAARNAVKSGFSKKLADNLLSDKEIANRHQILALADAGKAACKKGSKWSTIAASPKGMLKPKSYEKIYTVTDIKQQGDDQIATVAMEAVPSSKRAEDMPKDASGMGFFGNMFDEKDSYTGQMVINLTTGEIYSYNETLKAEWFAAESKEEQKSDKGPDQLTMGFSDFYSIEKVD